MPSTLAAGAFALASPGGVAHVSLHLACRSTTTSKLDNAITSQNDSFVNNQSDQQALLIRCAPYVGRVGRPHEPLSGPSMRADNKTRTWTS